MKLRTMLSFVIMVVVMLGIIGCAGREKYQRPGGQLLDLLPSVVQNGCYTKHLHSVVEQVSIYSLFNDFGVKGSFFLGTGTINSKEYVFTFIKDYEAYKRLRLEMDSLYIVETDQIYPSYVQAAYVSVIWDPLSKDYGKMRPATIEHFNILIVPVDTIAKKFELR